MENLSTAPGQTSDTRLIERAIRERWPIDDKHRATVVSRLTLIAASKNTSNREATSAAKALIAADAINLQSEVLELRRGRRAAEQREVPATTELHSHTHLHLHAPTPVLSGLAQRLEAIHAPDAAGG